jgi:hypothetical protein
MKAPVRIEKAHELSHLPATIAGVVFYSVEKPGLQEDFQDGARH